MFAELGSKRSDHPKVEEVDAVLPPHEVSWMGVRVKETLHKDLLVKAFKELASGFGALKTFRGVRDRYALDFFHH